jgi:hypothetical protein
MTLPEISRYRIVNQALSENKFSTTKDLLNHFGAMQAQDYAMAKWAIGARILQSEQMIEAAINAGEIIRTHILRPTWHFVFADDIHWMLALTAPHVKRQFASMCKMYNYDENAFSYFNELIFKCLEGKKELTREEVMTFLNIKSEGAYDFRASLIMMNAELDGLVCNGKMRGKQLTYTLLAEKIAPTSPISKEEALEKLARKYFSSHAPATLQDFVWWSGLSVANAKLGIEFIKKEFELIEIENQTYLFNNQLFIKEKIQEEILFLPAFDEILISYKDRTAAISLENQGKAFTKNGIFKPIIMQGGKVVGIWKRNIQKEKVLMEMEFFEDFEKNANLEAAAEKYGNYLALKPILK